MEGEQQQQLSKSRVVKVEAEERWELFMTQASNQGCPDIEPCMITKYGHRNIQEPAVLVHFGASWCVPSRAMNPSFEELAQAYRDILFLLVDVDELKGVASKLEVKAMPTFVLMKDGQVLNKIVGANPEEIKKMIDAYVQSSVF